MKRFFVAIWAIACACTWGCAASSAAEAPQQEAAATTPTETAIVTEQKQGGTSIQTPLLFEEGGLQVTATDLQEGEDGVSLNIAVRNAGEKDVALSTNYIVVNGFMVSGWFYSEVRCGKETESSLEISRTELTRAGIQTVYSLELYLCAFDPYTFETLMEYEPVTLLIPGTVEEEAKPAVGQELINDSSIVISSCDGGDGGLWIIIDNGSDRDIAVTAEDVRINGQTVSAWLCTVVLSGKKAVVQVELVEEEKEIAPKDSGLVLMTLKVLDFEPYVEMFSKEVAVSLDNDTAGQ